MRIRKGFALFLVSLLVIGRSLGVLRLVMLLCFLLLIFLNHDLLGALARKGENWARPMETGGAEAREQAVRFAVNIAMYVLCSDYKDDQVHAPFLMRRRHKKR